MQLKQLAWITSCLSTFQNGMGVFQTYTHISIEKIKRELANVKMDPEVGGAASHAQSVANV